MLLQISEKTCEVMEADRCSLFLLGAGGKGLDLLRIKTCAQRFGFDISVASQRCIYILTDRNLCLGRIPGGTQCQKLEDCFNSEGSTFYVFFSVTRGEML